jgi:hypothetical protein
MACPSGHELLDYHLTKLTKARRPAVEHHLDKCEFCCAELQLLESFPQDDICYCDESADLPAPLRRLAEALIHGGAPTLRAAFGEAMENEKVDLKC